MAEVASGVLLMAYGTPAAPEEIEPYYTHVRGGRPPAPEQLADLRRRYEAIGGTSPLVQRTTAQLEGLRAELGTDFTVELGFKHAPPFIEDAMTALLDAPLQRVVGLVLAPHSSALSTGQYHQRASAAAASAGVVDYIPAPRWNLDPVLVDLLAERVTYALGRFPAGATVETLFTAHSLPERALTLDEPAYPEQLRETAQAVASAAGLQRWRVAWQSAGRTPEPWIGPDVLEVIRAHSVGGEGAAEGDEVDGLLVCPAGFVSDHLEILYDIDIEARHLAESFGLRLERTDSLNDDPRFSKLLAELVRSVVMRTAAR